MKTSAVLFSAVLVVTGCRTVSTTTEVNTPNGYSRTTTTRGPYNTTTDTVINSREQFDECIKRNSPTMGSSGADVYCRGQTSGGGVPGVMPGYGVLGYGYGSPGMVRTCLPGSPACAPAIIPDSTPYGAVAMERSSGGARIYVTPAASGGASEEDVADLARATKAQHDAICRARPNDPMCCKSGDSGKQ
jgi:hypothetical protein